MYKSRFCYRHPSKVDANEDLDPPKLEKQFWDEHVGFATDILPKSMKMKPRAARGIQHTRRPAEGQAAWTMDNRVMGHVNL